MLFREQTQVGQYRFAAVVHGAMNGAVAAIVAALVMGGCEVGKRAGQDLSHQRRKLLQRPKQKRLPHHHHHHHRRQ